MELVDAGSISSWAIARFFFAFFLWIESIIQQTSTEFRQSQTEGQNLGTPDVSAVKLLSSANGIAPKAAENTLLLDVD